MKLNRKHSQARKRGFALLLVMIFAGIGLSVLSSAMDWASNSARVTDRNNRYMTTLAAAEASTESVVGKMSYDFKNGDQARVYDNLANYRTMVPTPAEHAIWNDFEFSNPAGVTARNYVENTANWAYYPLQSQYSGLYGMAASYKVISNARDKRSSNLSAAVMQEVQVATIPIFQFAIFYGVTMEISCGKAFNVTGRVHANKNLYVCPDSALTFQGDVTAVGNITFARAPGDSRGAPAGSVTYQAERDAKVAALSLPIGTNNTPQAVRAILKVPPAGESPDSLMGKQRYYNKADLILTFTNNTVIAKSGSFNDFATTIPFSEVSYFISTNATFFDTRESKTVKAIDIDVGKLRTWSATNASLRSVLERDVSSVYVADNRSMSSSYLGAVRLQNGAVLPPLGLTVATDRPMYVQGHFNAPVSSHRGTTNTTATEPSSLIADAITVLSTSWVDTNSTSSLENRDAGNTTVNAAFLAGIVETTTHNTYSGGTENFPRFLEDWGNKTMTYNGSMIVMFPSQYATAPWGMSNVYGPPTRNWAFDLNFLNASKLPPGTPSVSTLIRGQWAVLRPGTTK